MNVPPLFRAVYTIACCVWQLTHWGRATHICIGNLTIIGSDNGLSPGRRQAITWTNVGILLIGPLGINFSEMLIEIHAFSFKKIHLKMSSEKWRLFCLGLNVLTTWGTVVRVANNGWAYSALCMSYVWHKHRFVSEHWPIFPTQNYSTKRHMIYNPATPYQWNTHKYTDFSVIFSGGKHWLSVKIFTCLN